jgi:Leucine-rich repeat (LRR) protein
MVSLLITTVLAVLLFEFSHILPAFAATPSSQIEGLEFLFNSTNGTNWKWDNEVLNGPVWSFSSPQSDPCNDNNQVWQGITCSSSPNVCRTQDCVIVSLALDGYGLVGSLPYEFFSRVTTLETLVLTSSQKLTGFIPSELSLLSGLQVLSLALNRLTGTLPPELSSLVLLNFCSLYSNQLTGRIPSEFGKLSQLKSLSLDTNQLTGPIPVELGSLSQLNGFYLYSNFIAGSIPSELSSLSRLNSLSLYSNQLTGPIPSEFSSFQQMSALNLFSNHLTGSIPPQLSSLSKLNYFYLNTNDLSGPIPSEFGSLSRLVYLSLYRNHLTGSIPPELGAFPQLSVLFLNSNNLTGSIPPEFGSLSEMDLLYLNSNQLTGPLPTELGSLFRLGELSLDTNQLSESIPSELGLLTRLSLLSLSFNRFTGRLPSEFGSLVRMTSLSLDSNELNGPLPPEFSSLSLLRYFSLSGNQLTGSIPSQFSSLSRLNFLYFDSNRLAGSIPSALASMSQLNLFSISNNKFTGLIPSELSSLAQLSFLSLSFNLLTGPIPSEFGSLSRLNYFALSVNQLTGTIPRTLSSLSHLSDLFLYTNQLTGFIPSELSSLSVLNYFYLEDNQLTGTIPSQLDSLEQLNSFTFSRNQLSGLIPPSFFDHFLKLDSLDLSLNSLTGPIPANIGLLTSLEILDLSQNSLTGPLPSSITNMTNLVYLTAYQNNLHGKINFQLDSFPRLQQLFLQQNHFHGSLHQLFSTTVTAQATAVMGTTSSLSNHHPLINLDVSDNQLSGSLPSQLFLLPQLESISLSLNCFEHELPSSMCQAVGVRAISMSGLGSSNRCQNLVKVPFTSVSLVQTMDGSLPDCLWLLSNLKMLNLAGNGLTGTIGKSAAMSSLVSLTLSHNYLSGVIPLWLQERTVVGQLDLSHNKLTGTLDGFKTTEKETLLPRSLKLSVNRFSGDLSRSLQRYSTLDILSGNLFGCAYTPRSDKNSAWTICGSEEFDQSLFVMSGVCVLLILLLLFLGLSWIISPSLYKNPDTKNHSQQEHQHHTADHEVSGDQSHQPTSRNISSLWFQRRFLDCQTIILYTKYFSLDCLPLLNHNTSIASYGCFLSSLSKSMCLLSLLSLILSLPIYLLKVLDVESQNGNEIDESQAQYITHAHLYRWLYTTAFLSGAVPSVLLLTVTLLCLMAFCLIINFLASRREPLKENPAESCDHSISVVSSGTQIHQSPSQCQSNNEDLSEDNQPGELLMSAVWIILIVNIAVVGTVNGLYLWSTLLDLSKHIRILIQFSFGLFTLAWRVLIIDRGLPRQMKESRDGVWLFSCLNVVNTVLIPCVVTALSDPSCYQVSLSLSSPRLSSSHDKLLEIACSSR